MVPTGHSWNIMELHYEGCVPDRKGQKGWCSDFMEYYIEYNWIWQSFLDSQCIRWFQPNWGKTQTAKTLSTNQKEQTVVVASSGFTQEYFYILFQKPVFFLVRFTDLF